MRCISGSTSREVVSISSSCSLDRRHLVALGLDLRLELLGVGLVALGVGEGAAVLGEELLRGVVRDRPRAAAKCGSSASAAIRSSIRGCDQQALGCAAAPPRRRQSAPTTRVSDLDMWPSPPRSADSRQAPCRILTETWTLERPASRNRRAEGVACATSGHTIAAIAHRNVDALAGHVNSADAPPQLSCVLVARRLSPFPAARPGRRRPRKAASAAASSTASRAPGSRGVTVTRERPARRPGPAARTAVRVPRAAGGALRHQLREGRLPVAPR